MSEKSHVSLECAVCPATGQKHQTGNLLLDTRIAPPRAGGGLRKSMDRETVTHWAFCPEVQEKLDDGYVVLVVIDEEQSTFPYTPESVYRTGPMAYLKREAFDQIFDQPPPKDMAFIPQEVLDMLQKIPVKE